MASPRTQTVATAIACAVALGALAWYMYGASPSTIEQLSVSATPETATSSLPTRSDWQAAFLGATSTPTTLPTKEPPLKQASATDNSATDKLGIDLFTKYFQLRQAGLNSNSQTVSGMINQVVSENLSQLPAPVSYSRSDIAVGTAQPASIAAYSAAVSSAFSRYFPAKNDADIANDAFAANDMSQLALIDANIVLYKELVSSLLKATPPPSLVDDHVQLVNGASVLLYDAEALRHMDTDPLKGMAALGTEMSGLQAVYTSYSNIQAYLAAAGAPLK